jgi:hypothetical protein
MMRSLIMLAAVFALTMVLLPCRSSAETDISGRWHFVLNTDGGDREAAADFTLDGQKVTGKWGDAHADVAGTFKDGKLDLSFPYNSDEAGQGTLSLKGQLEGETISGTWSFQDYSGNFKASRQ